MKHYIVIHDKEGNIISQWKTDRKYKYAVNLTTPETPTNYVEDYKDGDSIPTSNEIKTTHTFTHTTTSGMWFWKKSFHHYL